jgi:hypothetical protein
LSSSKYSFIPSLESESSFCLEVRQQVNIAHPCGCNAVTCQVVLMQNAADREKQRWDEQMSLES